MLPAYTQDQVDWIEHIQIEDPPLVHLKKALDNSSPGLGRAIRPIYRAARATARGAKRMRGRR